MELKGLQSCYVLISRQKPQYLHISWYSIVAYCTRSTNSPSYNSKTYKLILRTHLFQRIQGRDKTKDVT